MRRDAAVHRPDPQPHAGVRRRLAGLMDALARGASPPGMIDLAAYGSAPFLGAARTDSQLRRRFTMIAQFDRNVVTMKRWSATGVALSLVLGAVALTGAVRGQAQESGAAQDDAAQPVAAASAPAAQADPAAPPFTDEDAAKLWQTKYSKRIVVVNGREMNREEVDRQFLRELEARKARAAGQVPPPQQPVDVETPEDRAVEAQLARPIPELNFDAVPFAEVVDFLRDVSGANVFVEWTALEAAGVDRSSPVTVRVKNVKFSQALDMVLKSGGKGVPLGYGLKGGVLRISTREDLDRETEIRAYDVRDIVPAEMEMKELATLISDSVDPSSWRDSGGTVGALHTSKHKLIVTTTEPNHRQIRSILQMLRDDSEHGPKTEAAATAAQGSN